MIVLAAAASGAVMKSAAARRAILKESDPGEEETVADVLLARPRALPRLGQHLRPKQLELEAPHALSCARETGFLDLAAMLRERRDNVLSGARGRFSRLFSSLDALLTLARIVGEQRSCVALKRLRLIRGLRRGGG